MPAPGRAPGLPRLRRKPAYVRRWRKELVDGGISEVTAAEGGLQRARGSRNRNHAPTSAQLKETVRSSRLGLTCGNGGWLGGCPQVKHWLPTVVWVVIHRFGAGVPR